MLSRLVVPPRHLCSSCSRGPAATQAVRNRTPHPVFTADHFGCPLHHPPSYTPHHHRSIHAAFWQVKDSGPRGSSRVLSAATSSEAAKRGAGERAHVASATPPRSLAPCLRLWPLLATFQAAIWRPFDGPLAIQTSSRDSLQIATHGQAGIQAIIFPSMLGTRGPCAQRRITL